MGNIDPAVFEAQKKIALAPDGLPWPPGYFDCMPRETFEEALKNYGVRPNCYIRGFPGYTEAETARPEFKCSLQNEPPEENEYWKKVWENSRQGADLE